MCVNCFAQLKGFLNLEVKQLWEFAAFAKILVVLWEFAGLYLTQSYCSCPEDLFVSIILLLLAYAGATGEKEI